MAYWKIMPHKDTEFDVCLMPGDNDHDHNRAREYAQDVLEQLWDQVNEGDGPVTVTIELVSGGMPSGS